MSETAKALKRRVLDALAALFRATNIAPADTREALLELQAEVESLLEVLGEQK